MKTLSEVDAVSDESERRKILFLEAVRYAELCRDDLGDDEYGTMIRAVWTLLDPAKVADRPTSVSTYIKNENGDNVRFSAHSHEKEPLRLSFDDIIVYRSMENGNGTVRYITDRFCPKKII